MNCIKSLFLLLAAVIITLPCRLSAETRTFKLNKRYLNIPVSYSSERREMTFATDKGEYLSVDIRLAKDKIDYWVFRDVSALKGKQLTVTFEDDGLEGFQKMYLDDKIEEQDMFYKESNRPLFHFTTRRGWNNDPNGLVYYEGEYHLFYQYNPYENEWGNMHWGHAVSKDLVHWQELPLVLEPDHLGAMFSGCAVIDYENTSGFGKKGNPAMVAIYTANNAAKEIQCIAYSLDKGRTFTKYKGNPVLDSYDRWKSHELRDPKVFWYAPGKHWVMALYEVDGISIYNSKNLKDWTYESHVRGFYECPDLFELPVDGDSQQKKWVMLGASQTYMIGSFDGKTFTPENGKYAYTYWEMYAAQTFGNMNGRTVQIGWGRPAHPGMPFKSMMTIPTELSLVTTKDGVRLKSYPIKEMDQLKTSVGHWKNLEVAEATEKINTFKGEEALCIKATITTAVTGRRFTLKRCGQSIVEYDFNFSRLNGMHYFLKKPDALEMDIEVYMDRTSYEVFLDGGLLSYTLERNKNEKDAEGFSVEEQDVKVVDLEVFRMKSIWNE